MDTIRQWLKHELNTVIERLRHLDGTVAVEERPGPSGITSSRADDEVDEIQAGQRRQIDCATQELLVRRLNRLSAALDRLDAGEVPHSSVFGACTT